MFNSRYLASIFLSCVLIIITGCGNNDRSVASDNNSNKSPIERIKDEQLLDTSLTITGKVDKVVPLLNSYAYAITDGQELIWVITTQQPPQKLTAITIEATVNNQIISIDGEEYPEYYLTELKRIGG